MKLFFTVTKLELLDNGTYVYSERLFCTNFNDEGTWSLHEKFLVLNSNAKVIVRYKFPIIRHPFFRLITYHIFKRPAFKPKYKYYFKKAKFEIVDDTLKFNKKESGKCWNVTGYFEKRKAE